MTNKIKEFENQIEIKIAQQEEYRKNIQSMEVELVTKKNDLNSLMEKSQRKKMTMER